MKTSFLDYYKQILEKVSFDRHLMRKEYYKARTLLSPDERLQLDAWLRGRGIVLSPPEFQSSSFNQDVRQRRLAGQA